MFQLFQHAFIFLQNKNDRSADICKLTNHFFCRCGIKVTGCRGDCPTTGTFINSTHTDLHIVPLKCEGITVQSNKALVNSLLGLPAEFFDCACEQNNYTIVRIRRLIDKADVCRRFARLNITNTQTTAHKSLALSGISEQIHYFIGSLVQLIDRITVPMLFLQQVKSVSIPEFGRKFGFRCHIPRIMVLFLDKMPSVNSYE